MRRGEFWSWSGTLPRLGESLVSDRFRSALRGDSHAATILKLRPASSAQPFGSPCRHDFWANRIDEDPHPFADFEAHAYLILMPLLGRLCPVMR